MDLSSAVDWSREALKLSLLLGGPVLAVALAVGVLVGVGQTLTQMHEPVVGQVPRLAAVVVALMFLLPWLATRWAGFASSLFEAIPSLL